MSNNNVKCAVDNALRYSANLSNSILVSVLMLDHQFTLKNSFIVILLRNLQPANGLVNGAQYILESMTSNVFFLLSVNKRGNRNCLILPRIPCDLGDEDFSLPRFSRTQLFVGVCFVITINKVQGLSTSEALGIDLCHECLTYGQLYKSLSKIPHPSKSAVCTTHDNGSTSSVVVKKCFLMREILYKYSKGGLAGLLSNCNYLLQT